MTVTCETEDLRPKNIADNLAPKSYQKKPKHFYPDSFYVNSGDLMPLSQARNRNSVPPSPACYGTQYSKAVCEDLSPKDQ